MVHRKNKIRPTIFDVNNQLPSFLETGQLVSNKTIFLLCASFCEEREVWHYGEGT